MVHKFVDNLLSHTYTNTYIQYILNIERMARENEILDIVYTNDVHNYKFNGSVYNVYGV